MREMYEISAVDGEAALVYLVVKVVSSERVSGAIQPFETNDIP